MTLSGKFTSQLDLTSITDCVYCPQRFSGAVCAHQGCTFLLFKTGSFVCLGSTSKHMGSRCIESIAKRLNVGVSSCLTKNIVMSHRLDYKLNMRELYGYLRKTHRFVTFEEELFNGILWKEGGGTVRLFHTGSFFVTGLCTVMGLKNVCNIVCKICKLYKK